MSSTTVGADLEAIFELSLYKPVDDEDIIHFYCAECGGYFSGRILAYCGEDVTEHTDDYNSGVAECAECVKVLESSNPCVICGYIEQI